MSLPTSRNTTYAPGSIVKSDDLNDLQDKIIDLNDEMIAADLEEHDFRQDQVETFLPGSLFREGILTAAPIGGPGQKGYMYPPSGGGGIYHAPVMLPVGKRVVSLALKIGTDATGGTRTFRFKRTDLATNAVTTIDSGSTGGVSGDHSISLSGINHTILTGMAYWVEVEVPAGAEDALKGYLQVHDHPSA